MAMDAQIQEKLIRTIARHEEYLGRVARMLAADARGEPLPADAQFHPEELESLESSAADLCMKLTGSTEELSNWTPPRNFAYEHYHDKSGEMAWMMEYEQGLRLSKRYFESFLPLVQKDVHTVPDTEEIPSTVPGAQRVAPISTAETTKFYETPGFAIAVTFLSLSAAAVFTVLGVRMKNLSWLFVPAWAFAIPAVMILSRNISKKFSRNLARIVILVIIGLILFWMDRVTQPTEPKPTEIIWYTPPPITVGTPLSKEQLNATASSEGRNVEGSVIYNPTFGDKPPAGTITLQVTFRPNDPSLYRESVKTVVLVVRPQIESQPANLPAVQTHKPSLTTEQSDPRIELVKEARDMAQRLVNLHDQIKADVDENHKRRDENIQTDLYGPNGVPRFHTEQEKNDTIRFANERWEPEEINIRVNGVKIYRNCCQDSAIKIREQLMVCAPKVSSYEQMDNYKRTVEGKIDLNLSPISAAGFNLGDYSYAAADLRKLADACEVKIKQQ